ncbi:MAG: ELWxxDGT repeat protein [Planctomycetota bacterium]
MIKLHHFLAALVLSAACLTAQTATLVKDINRTGIPGSSTPGPFATIPGSTVFVAQDPTAGRELFVTDGTTAGTRLLADLRPGSGDSNPADFTVAVDRVFFTADDGVRGRELWVTDGTTAGTSFVSDITPGPTSSDPRHLAAFGRNLVFSATRADLGRELWTSDGSAAGTAVIRDIRPGAASGDPRDMHEIAGQVYFTARDTRGYELWISDGSTAGTRLVKDINPGPADGTTWPLVDLWQGLGGKLLFVGNDGVSGTELWESDGTEAGTRLLKDVNPGAASSSLGEAAEHGGFLYFSGLSGASGTELWRTDGTAAGTQLVVDLVPATGSADPFELTSAGPYLFFTATLPASTLLRTDGTAAGTLALHSVPLGYGSAARALTPLGNELIFSGTDFEDGAELWRSDGTVSGTAQIKDIRPGGPFSHSSPRELTPAPGGTRVLFSADEPGSGREPWITDGTAAGTVLLANLNDNDQTNPSNPDSMVVLGGIHYFRADDGVNGTELWRSDGTDAGTSLVFDIHPGPASGLRFRSLRVAGDRLFFLGSDPATGTELWCSDGTSAGTRRLRDIAAGSANAQIENLTVVGERLFFSAVTAAAGAELWTSDGTPAGTVMVADLLPGGASSSPSEFIAYGSKLLFAADDGVTGAEPWITDGTAAGTTSLRDIHPTGSSGFEPMGEFAGLLYFGADDGVAGQELWRTDGTPAGTQRFADLRPGGATPRSSSPRWFAKTTEEFYFIAQHQEFGVEVWGSNGTVAGTRRVTDIRPGASSGGIIGLHVVNDRLVFEANDGFRGAELWRLDPSQTRGARIIRQLSPVASLSSFLSEFEPVGSRALYFRAGDSSSNRELWSSDGLDITLVSELVPGATGSIPQELKAAGGMVLFNAIVPPIGAELWRIDTRATARSFGQGCGAATLLPRLQATDPVLGGVATFRGDFDVGSTGVLLLGLRSTPSFRFGPCAVSGLPPTLAVLAPYTPSNGSWSQAIPLPAVAALTGLEAVAQAASATPGFGLGVGFTNAVELVFGQ